MIFEMAFPTKYIPKKRLFCPNMTGSYTLHKFRTLVHIYYEELMKYKCSTLERIVIKAKDNMQSRSFSLTLGHDVIYVRILRVLRANLYKKIKIGTSRLNQ